MLRLARSSRVRKESPMRSERIERAGLVVALLLVVAAWDVSPVRAAAPPDRPVSPSPNGLFECLGRLQHYDWENIAARAVNYLVGFPLLNVYSTDPNERILKLLDESEDLRQIEYEWERIWFTDQPSHLTPERVHDATQG